MRKTKRDAVILLGFFAIYIIALLKITIFKYPDAGAPGSGGLNLIPFDTIAEFSRRILNGQFIIGVSNLLGNFVIFIPLGYLVAELFPKMRKFIKIFSLAFIFSSGIEIFQYIFARGAADIDDVILNTLGGIAGYLLYVLLSELFTIKSAVAISALMITFICAGFFVYDNFKFFAVRPARAVTRDNDQMEEIKKENIKNDESRQENARLLSNIRLNSLRAYLIRLDEKGNEILFDDGGDERVYPASLTKIMTAVIALENIENLDDQIVLGSEMFRALYECSQAGFEPGEIVSALDLLYGLALPSGAECAVGLAERISGTESAFAALMNEKARELGMNGTHFMNSTGMHDANHYTTAKDMAALTAYAIQNDGFYKIFTTDKYLTKPTIKHPNGVAFYSTLFSNMNGASFSGGVILGGKTGYTDEAGQCLASLSEKNGERLILITFGAPGDNKTRFLHIEDAKKVLSAVYV
jgi:D-alanyl-D-alanine carboxypeptidase (penicillin-binding protein 5/6)